MAADLKTADIGVYGLGTMGSALALNLAEQGFRVAATRRLRILSTVSRNPAASCS